MTIVGEIDVGKTACLQKSKNWTRILHIFLNIFYSLTYSSNFTTAIFCLCWKHFLFEKSSYFNWLVTKWIRKIKNFAQKLPKNADVLRNTRAKNLALEEMFLSFTELACIIEENFSKDRNSENIRSIVWSYCALIIPHKMSNALNYRMWFPSLKNLHLKRRLIPMCTIWESELKNHDLCWKVQIKTIFIFAYYNSSHIHYTLWIFCKI